MVCLVCHRGDTTVGLICYKEGASTNQFVRLDVDVRASLMSYKEGEDLSPSDNGDVGPSLSDDGEEGLSPSDSGDVGPSLSSDGYHQVMEKMRAQVMILVTRSYINWIMDGFVRQVPQHIHPCIDQSHATTNQS